jgi:FkbM family methyltransferase
MSDSKEKARTHYEPIGLLWESGVRYGSVIDVGCADGQFSVILSEYGVFRNCTILNIDAQEIYSESLAAIQETLGGHYRICAVGERDGGSIELQRGAHAYWTSLRPPGDRYWEGLNELRETKPFSVPLRSLDALVAELRLPAPYVLKMDIQGAEAQALAGATRALADTILVSVEVMLEDFNAIHEVLTRNGFELFEISDLSYAHSTFMGWFYATYVKPELSALRPAALWDAGVNDRILARQVERREEVRSMLKDSLSRFRAGKWPPLPEL